MFTGKGRFVAQPTGGIWLGENPECVMFGEDILIEETPEVVRISEMDSDLQRVRLANVVRVLAICHDYMGTGFPEDHDCSGM